MGEKFQQLPLRSASLFASFLSLALALQSAVDLSQASQQFSPQKNSGSAPLPAGARMRIGAADLRPLARKLAFSPDGSSLATVGDHTHLWDVATGKHLRELYPKPYMILPSRNSIHFSRDGATLFGIASERTLASWDMATGKRIRTIYATDADKCICSFMVSPDGEQLIVEIGRAEGVKADDADDLHINQLQLWNLSRGKLVRSFQKARYYQKVGDGFYCGRLAFAPDGKTVAAADQSGTIVLWDVTTGKKLREILTTDFKRAISDVTFSANSRSLLSTDCRALGLWGFSIEDAKGMSLRIRDVATGKERFSIPGTYKGFARLSPDDRTVAISNGFDGFGLYELLTGQELRRFKVKGNRLMDLAFTPDGQTVASVTYDKDGEDVLIWDLIPADWHPPFALQSAEKLLALWKTLAEDDASAAYRSVLTLAAQPAQTIPFLKTRLTPIPTARPEQIRQLIADLDADAFQRRKAASKELARLGSQAESALRVALADSPSVELRKRTEHLLNALNEWVIKEPELLRIIRAIWVLQRIGTSEARALLEKLASGAPAARQTQEAKTALRFLDHLMIR